MSARPLSRASSITSDVSVVGGPFSVKATLKGVTRRITLREPPTWGDLEAQIRRVFGISSSVSVTYFDDDGDAITLDSDMELKELASVQRAIGRNSVKLTVQIRDGANAETQQRQEEPIDVDAEDDAMHDAGAPAEPPAAQAPAPAPSALAANDDWNMVPQASSLPAESPIDAPAAPAQLAQLDAAHPPAVPTPATATAPVVAMEESQPPQSDALSGEPTVSAPVPPSEGKGKEKATNAGSGAAMETDIPADTDVHDEEIEELTVEQITAEMQDAIMDAPAQVSAAAPASAPAPALPADLPPSRAPTPPQVHPQPQPLPADLSASFHRVVDEITRAVNALAAGVTQGYERAEAERVRADLMRDVGVMVEQLRLSVTTSATVLFSQLQTETARIVDEIRSRAEVYRHQLEVEHGASHIGASSSDSDSDSSSSDDERLPTGGFDDWALGFTSGMGAADKRAARKEMKRAQREWRRGAKEAGKVAKKELKGAEKAARDAAKEARRQARRARREAGREVAVQTRSLAHATATLTRDTLVSVANNLAHTIAGPTPVPPLPPRPTPAQAAAFAGDVFRTVAGQVGASISAMTGPYPGSVGGAAQGPAPVFVPTHVPAPVPVVAPVPATVPSQPPTPTPIPTVPAPAPAPVPVPAPAPFPTPAAVPPAPVERFGFELRRLREMGFEAGANGESLESMLERYEGDVANVIAELVGV